MMVETLVASYTGDEPPAWAGERAKAMGIALEPMLGGRGATSRTEAAAASQVAVLRPHVYVMNWPWDPYLSAAIAERDDRLGMVCFIATSSTLEDYDSYMDVAYLRRRSVVLASTPGQSTVSVAEGTLALLLALNVGFMPIAPSATEVSPLPRRRETLFGSTIGIVGMGRIGQRVAALASALGVRIRYFSRSRRQEIEDELAANLL